MPVPLLTGHTNVDHLVKMVMALFLHGSYFSFFYTVENHFIGRSFEMT